MPPIDFGAVLNFMNTGSGIAASATTVLVNLLGLIGI